MPVLDEILRGGFPKNRAVLLAGGPGTGKTTMAMQFLQAGLEAGEECLFVSTEQTAAELRDAFEPYEFEIDHDRLTITTIHAAPGRTLDGDGELELTLETLGEDASIGQDFSAPFNGEYVRRFLEHYGPCDRVVFDSVSGLAAMADDQDRFRRLVLDLIRLFSDQFRATTLFTAEETEHAGRGAVADCEALQFNTHGVIKVWHEQIDGDYHRFLRVVKMRGIDHDTRARELELRPDGVRLTPRRLTRSSGFMPRKHQSTGMPGLDELTGGGLIRGSTALLEHDGRAQVDPLIVRMIVTAIENGDAIVLFPSANMDPNRLEKMLPPHIGSVDELIERDQLFVLDFIGTWQPEHDHVFSFGQETGVAKKIAYNLTSLRHRRIKRATQRINDVRGDRTAFSVLHTESLLQHLDPNEIRQLYYWAKENLLQPDDRVLFVQNPSVMDETLAEFYAYDAEQILRTWLHDEGLQYIKLEKAPSGHLGSTRLVEHTEAPPYVAVQRLNARRETTGDGDTAEGDSTSPDPVQEPSAMAPRTGRSEHGREHTTGRPVDSTRERRKPSKRSVSRPDR